MKRLTKKKIKSPVRGQTITKARGFDNLGLYAHSLLSFGMVAMLGVLIYSNLTPLAIALYLISKWRIIAVQPRYWWANFRSNVPDMAVSLSFIHQMHQSMQLEENSFAFLLVWGVLFAGWQLILKPKSTNIAENTQAMIAQAFGLSTLMYYGESYPELLIILSVWVLSASVARHFLFGYDEPLIKVMSVSWALFITQLTWVMSRWLLVFEVGPTLLIPYVVVMIGAIQYAIGSLYHHYKEADLKNSHVKQFIVFVCAIMLMIILFSNWTGEI